MSVPRLTFLYPHLFKPVRGYEYRPMARSFGQHQRSTLRRGLHASNRSNQTATQRYGPAVESSPPLLPPEKPRKNTPVETAKEPITGAKQPVKSNVEEEPRANAKQDSHSTQEQLLSPPHSVERAATSAETDAAESHPKEIAAPKSSQTANGPLERVLHMEAPTSKNSAKNKPPHLQAPPYVHHFDTYTLVKDLGKGSFTSDQSITVMKAVRSLLAVNLDLAREGLVSKSDVENETYLFRAACSELRTEIQNARKSSSDKMRTERAHLQHDADILNQKVTQETLTLKDDLKGMFDDRKMGVRMEQRSMDSSIQELNYKISVALNSDTKGEVEGLRWFLTRRAALFICTMALLILGSLRYSSHMVHVQEEERKKMASALSGTSTGSGSGSNYTVASRSMSTQTGDSDAALGGMDSGLG